MMPSTMLRDVVVGSSAGREPETESVRSEQSSGELDGRERAMSGKLDGRDGGGPGAASRAARERRRAS